MGRTWRKRGAARCGVSSAPNAMLQPGWILRDVVASIRRQRASFVCAEQADTVHDDRLRCCICVTFLCNFNLMLYCHGSIRNVHTNRKQIYRRFVLLDDFKLKEAKMLPRATTFGHWQFILLPPRVRHAGFDFETRNKLRT